MQLLQEINLRCSSAKLTKSSYTVEPLNYGASAIQSREVSAIRRLLCTVNYRNDLGLWHCGGFYNRGSPYSEIPLYLIETVYKLKPVEARPYISNASTTRNIVHASAV